MPLPIITIVGRPNVGKSTLFNRLTQSRNAIVADLPGVTRDRQYGDGKIGPVPYLLVDTGGLLESAAGIDALTQDQAYAALKETQAILFIVDGRAGLTAEDHTIANKLRRLGKPLFLVVNKVEGLPPATVSADFFVLGLGEPHLIAAAHGEGVKELMQLVLAPWQELPVEPITPAPGIRLAIVGRPNVGKSTLINRMLGESRVITSSLPGTTRDSIEVPFTHFDQAYVLIDTAGVRRRGRIDKGVEQYSVTQTLQAIQSAHVTLLVLDASEGITEQDLHLLGYCLNRGTGLVIASNKWDGLSQEQRQRTRDLLDRRLTFVDFAKHFFISALHGTGVGELWSAIETAYTASLGEWSTPLLTTLLEQAVETHQPPLVRGRRVKLRYAHQGGKNPPVIVVHGNQVKHLPDSYARYLSHFFRDQLKLHGTPLRIELRSGNNPYA